MGTSSAASSSSQSDTTVVTCGRCGAKNRVARGRAQDEPRCGRCQEPLALAAPPAHPVTVTDATFAAEVEGAPLPVLVDFWAPWCGPCRAVGPVLDQMAGERAGKLKIAKVNVDDNPRLASRFHVQAIPTMLLFKDGRVVETIRGALPKAALEGKLAPHL